MEDSRRAGMHSMPFGQSRNAFSPCPRSVLQTQIECFWTHLHAHVWALGDKAAKADASLELRYDCGVFITLFLAVTILWLGWGQNHRSSAPSFA